MLFVFLFFKHLLFHWFVCFRSEVENLTAFWSAYIVNDSVSFFNISHATLLRLNIFMLFFSIICIHSCVVIFILFYICYLILLMGKIETVVKSALLRFPKGRHKLFYHTYPTWYSVFQLGEIFYFRHILKSIISVHWWFWMRLSISN